MGKLVVVRPRQWADRFRKYRIYVDGERVAEIRSGETQEILVKDGPHEIWTKVDWCISNKIVLHIDSKEVLYLQAGTNVRGLRLLFAIFYLFRSFFGGRGYLYLRQIRELT